MTAKLTKKVKPTYRLFMLMSLSIPVLSQASTGETDYQDVAMCDEFIDIYSSDKNCVAIVTDRAGNMFTTPPTQEVVHQLGIKQGNYAGPNMPPPSRNTYSSVISEGDGEYLAPFVTFYTGVYDPRSNRALTAIDDFYAAADWCSMLASNKFGGVDNWQLPSASEYFGVLDVFTSLDPLWPKEAKYATTDINHQGLYKPGDPLYIFAYDFKLNKVSSLRKESSSGSYTSCMAPAKEAEIVVEDAIDLNKIKTNTEYTAIFRPKSGSEGGFEGKTMWWVILGDCSSSDVHDYVDVIYQSNKVESDASSIKFRVDRPGKFQLVARYYPEEGESYIVSEEDKYYYQTYGGYDAYFVDQVVQNIEVVEGEYKIDSQQELEEIAANPYKLEEIFVNADTVIIRTSDNNWIEKLALPDDLSLSDGKELRFVRDAGWPTEFSFSNKSLEIDRYTEILLRYTDGQFKQVYENLISEDDSLVVEDASILQRVSAIPDVLGTILADSNTVLLVDSDGDLPHLKVSDNIDVNEGQELIILRQGKTPVKVTFNNREINLDRNESVRLKYTAGQFELIVSDVAPLHQISSNFSYMMPSLDSSVYIYIPYQESVNSSSGQRKPGNEVWEHKKGHTKFNVNVKDAHGKSYKIDMVGYKKYGDSRYAIENAVFPGNGSFVFAIDRNTLAYEQLHDGRYSGQVKLILQGWDNQAFAKEINLDINFVK
ncbi:hypothetical protein [Cysteiniphilum litorale]|uniref:hypothetical protein n=1 Tax=Cysteiniphilum litorale TaxID=2056700 RepID=UPI003F88250E